MDKPQEFTGINTQPSHQHFQEKILVGFNEKILYDFPTYSTAYA